MRGRAALSIRSIHRCPSNSSGWGKQDALEVFHPERKSFRISRHGDVLSINEKAQEAFDEQESLDLAKKSSQHFSHEDFRKTTETDQKMVISEQIFNLLPEW
jgi:signal recognition particle subunit SRP54